MMEGFLPRGWDLAKIDALLRPPSRGDRRAPAVVASRFRAGRLRLGRRFRRHDGPRDRPAIKRARDAGPAGRADLAGRPDGHVPLGGLFPQGMERRVRPRLRLQHGRVERPRRRDPASRTPGAFQNAMQAAFYGPLGDAHRPASATAGSPRPTACRTTPSASAS